MRPRAGPRLAPESTDTWRTATGHVAVSPLTWLSTGQSTGEAVIYLELWC
jgi:hypothetical protein